MKKCPQCGREYDLTMSFCLDDGSELLYGPASMDEPQTAILSQSGAMSRGNAPSESSTRMFTTAGADTDGGLRSIAVLPFRNIGGDAENEYFSDGLTEELIADLSKVRALRVISRGSSMRLKGSDKDTRTIARELNVRYILDGSVRKAGDNIRIAAQLIDGLTDENLWADKYSGTLVDVFEIQETVSRAIVDAMRVTLSADDERRMEERPIADPRAYDLYLRARAKFMQGNAAALDRSIELLKQGLAIIGDNELLYAALGYTYYFCFKWISKLDQSYLRHARECMEKLFELNPGSTHGFTLKGLLSYSGGDIVESVVSLKKAVEIDPNNSEAMLWLTIYSEYFEGSRSEATRFAEQIHRLDPLHPSSTLVRTFVYIYSGDLGEDPIRWVERGLAMDPTSPLAIWLAVIAKAWCGKPDEVAAHADRLAEIAPGWVYTEHALFLKHALRDEKESALSHYSPDFEVESEHDPHFALHVAHCFALIGDKDRALDFLEVSVKKGMLNHSFIGKWDPLLENLRNEERFARLIDEAKRRMDAARPMLQQPL